MIAFSGPRVIEQTIREKLPDGFQRSEFLREKGQVDIVSDRRELKKTLGRLLVHLMPKRAGDDTPIGPLKAPLADVPAPEAADKSRGKKA